MDLIAKIMSEYRRVRLNRTYLIRQNVPWDIKERADGVREDILYKYRFDGWIRREYSPAILVMRGVLEENYTDQINLLQKRADDYKFQLYLERRNPRSTVKLRQQINNTHASLSKLLDKLYSIDQYTLDYFAEQESFFYILSRIVKPQVKNRQKLIRLANLMQLISLKDIRRLARSDTWRAYWAAKKQAIFRHTPLSNEQLSLATFSRMYDNVYSHPEKPESFVIDDDDMLDGWVLSHDREDLVQSKVKNSKVAQSNEVFVMAGDQVQANEVYAKNSPEARLAQQTRQKQLERFGGMKYTDFADMKQERMMRNAGQK
jgi:hypothetical protein